MKNEVIAWAKTARKVKTQSYAAAGLGAIVEATNPQIAPLVAEISSYASRSLAPSLGEPLASLAGTIIAALVFGAVSRYVGWVTPEPVSSLRK